MDLTFDRIPDYVDLLASADPGRRHPQTVDKVRAEAESKHRVLARTKILDRDGVLIASIRAEPIEQSMWILTELKMPPALGREFRDVSTILVAEACAQARAEGARKIESRIPVSSLFPAYRAALQGEGFVRHGGRIEFEAKVEDLPDERGTPFVWEASTAEMLPVAADLLDAASAGDPSSDPEDRWATLLPALLADPYLNGGPECVHIGRIEGKSAAVVAAQVAPTTGWSRITYMGLLPSWRGLHLGRWIHRHGFQMMREQGGRTYEGGCASDNKAMVALFRGHGCRETVVFDVWEWRG